MTKDDDRALRRPSDRTEARGCAYTVLLGGYERLTEQPVARHSGVDFLCFTDDPTLESETWSIRQLTPLFPGDKVRSQRQAKIQAHAILPEYDVSLYLDNSVLLRRTPEEILEALLPEDALLAIAAHSFRQTVIDEFRMVVSLGLDRADRCEEQERHYRIHDPESLGLRPLWSGLLLRRHHEPRVVEAMNAWCLHVLRYSRRDQLSAHYAFRAAGLEPVVHELDNLESAYHRWPVSVGRRPDTSLWNGPDAVALEHRVRALQAELDRLRSSRSWRVTQPARQLRARLGPSPQTVSSASTSPEPSQEAASR